MIPAAVMLKLATLGLSHEHAEAVASMLSEVEAATKAEAGGAIEARRASDRARKAKQRHVTSREVTGRDGTSVTPPPKRKVSPCTPSKENNPPSISEPIGSSIESVRSLADEFDAEFWPAYPEKVGKPAARKAWPKARGVAGLDQIMGGLRRYLAGKPADRSWMHPATFLNGERWNDQPAPVALRSPTGQPGARAPPRRSGSDLMVESAREMIAEFAGKASGSQPPHEGPTIDVQATRSR